MYHKMNLGVHRSNCTSLIHHLNNFVRALTIVFPIFLSNPILDIGTPVVRLMFCLTFVIPNARFHEKLRPGMGDFCLYIYLFVLTIPI